MSRATMPCWGIENGGLTRRSYTGTEISVGSIVGQSTLLTAPTVTASIMYSEASLI
jgi:hypothetical protein